MKTIKVQDKDAKCVAFTNKLITYGRCEIFQRRKYTIEIHTDFKTVGAIPLTIYKSYRKPRIRSIYLLTIIFTPIAIVIFITSFTIAIMMYIAMQIGRSITNKENAVFTITAITTILYLTYRILNP